MRYATLGVLLFLLIALVLKKLTKDYSFLECLFFTYILVIITSFVAFLVFIFIKYW
jgi:hypothetical protein